MNLYLEKRDYATYLLLTRQRLPISSLQGQAKYPIVVHRPGLFTLIDISIYLERVNITLRFERSPKLRSRESLHLEVPFGIGLHKLLK